MSRKVKKPIALFSLAFIIVLIPIWWRLRAPTCRIAAQGPQPAHAANLEVNAIRAGLDAKALAAAGLTAQATTSARRPRPTSSCYRILAI